MKLRPDDVTKIIAYLQCNDNIPLSIRRRIGPNAMEVIKAIRGTLKIQGLLPKTFIPTTQEDKMAYVPPQKPFRDPDHFSKRGVAYWWSPEWVRGTDYRNCTFGRIKAIKEKSGEVNLYMVSKDGNLTYIQGSIQKEFKDWHEARKIDYFFLAEDPDELDDIILQSEA